MIFVFINLSPPVGRDRRQSYLAVSLVIASEAAPLVASAQSSVSLLSEDYSIMNEPVSLAITLAKLQVKFLGTA